jgi:glycosyltransferase involved in cell wall biosynthesis
MKINIYSIISIHIRQEKIMCIIIILLIIQIIIRHKESLKKENLELNNNYIKIKNDLNLSFSDKLNKKIRIGIYTIGLSGAGLQRSTSLMVSNLYQIKLFDIILFTVNKHEENEYIIPKDIKRIIIQHYNLDTLIKEANKRMIDILIYQFPVYDQIKRLNKLKNIKVIFYLHQSFLYWIYYNYFLFINLYKTYQTLKYVISLIPFENDYLFKKWDISSILMDNFISYEYNSIIQSDLSSKIILMIGRASDKLKRFNLGIKSMKYIIQEIPDCELKIITDLLDIDYLQNLKQQLNLGKYINFIGFTSTPEIYFKNSSLHLFPSISECFPMVLCETKIYGIPNILIGFDYVKMAKGGTIILYDDSPESISRESINILKNLDYRKKLGKEARKSMKKFKNELLLKRWVKLILSIFKGDVYYQNFKNQDRKTSENKSLNIIKNQIKLLKMRNKNFENITINKLENFSFMEQIISLNSTNN